jgi:hypothetical protein
LKLKEKPRTLADAQRGVDPTRIPPDLVAAVASGNGNRRAGAVDQTPRSA